VSAPDSRRLFRRAVWTVAFLCGSSLTIASATAGHGDRPNTDTAVAHELAVTTDAAPMVGLAASADGHGYWIAAADGHVWNYGDAPALGGVHTALQRPIVGMAATPDAHGYWLVASDGGIFSFGDARFYGSTGAMRLNQPIVGMATTPAGHGYWLVASDGGIFSFGDARFYGSTGAMHLNRPIVGMARTASGHGYWLVARDGGLFTFGDARFHGSLGGTPPGSPIVGMAATRDRAGYWMVSDAGGVYAFGSATPHGEIIKDAYPRGVEALVPTGDENGYWLLTARGAVLGFGDASWYGSIVRPRRHPIGLTHLRLYGDSLVTQADPDFHFQIEDSGYSLQDANFIGAALCDALPDMYGTRRSVPDEVVLAFSGNTRPCLPAGAATDGDVFVDGYRHASEQAVAAFAAEGTMVVFALPPPRLDNPATAYLPGVYKDVAQQWPELARAYDAGANVAGPNNTWVATLPCLPFETASMGCTNGNIAVRAPDKLHFCPGGLADPNNIWSGCALWSSGSWRYAMGLFHAAQTGRP
jgi:hypothetical protein